MEENRSFDHMFGYYPGVNGLTGKEWNPYDTSHPEAGGITVSRDAPYVAPCDPNHGTPATTLKIFGRNATEKKDFSDARMDGFVEFETNAKHVNACDVMKGFTPDKLPVMTALAQEFVLFDRYFCSHAGPTWPNRMYFLSATSAGSTETGPWYLNEVGKLFPQKTFYDQVAEAGFTWRNYYNDTPWELFMESIAHHPENLVSMDQFFKDASEGNLPNYAFINPRCGINITTGIGSTDQHPDHDVAAGEQFYKDIYEALRSSPQWNDTLFIITYDEHGGFYDHVPTPLNVPPPDGDKSYPDADVLFNRLGIRIPTLVISPWVPKGFVVSEPPAAQKPAANSEYEATSIMSTVRKILGINAAPLTKRDAWSATFEHILETMDTPRTDCPLHLPAAPPPALSIEAEAEQPPNELQMHIMTVLSHLNQMPYPHHIQKQEHVSHWANIHYQNHAKRTLNWKVSKYLADTTYEVIVQPQSEKNWTELDWVVNYNSTIPYMTISTKHLNSSIEVTTTDKRDHSPISVTETVHYCLDAGDAQVGTVLVSLFAILQLLLSITVILVNNGYGIKMPPAVLMPTKIYVSLTRISQAI